TKNQKKMKKIKVITSQMFNTKNQRKNEKTKGNYIPNVPNNQRKTTKGNYISTVSKNQKNNEGQMFNTKVPEIIIIFLIAFSLRSRIRANQKKITPPIIITKLKITIQTND